jgi:predicted transcriptional regulator
MAVKNLTQQQIDFIHQQKGKMKQKVIASLIGVTPACVNKRIKSGKVVDGFFDTEDFKKYYTA